MRSVDGFMKLVLAAGCVGMLAGCTSSAETSPGNTPTTNPTQAPTEEPRPTAQPSLAAAGSTEAPAMATVAPAAPTVGPAASVSETRSWKLVALGDSLAQRSCSACETFVDLYGDAITQATGVVVEVDNRASPHFSNVPPVQATQLLSDILTDASLRDAIATADIVLVNVGFNDTPWNRLDNPCDASDPTATVVDWSKITSECIARVTGEYRQTLDEIFTQIDKLRGCWTPPGEPTSCRDRGHEDTMLRLTTVYDDWIGEEGTTAEAVDATATADQAFVEAQCWVVREHGGDCANVFRVLNGLHGSADAAQFLGSDHTHLNSVGAQAVADALASLGYHPLQ